MNKTINLTGGFLQFRNSGCSTAVIPDEGEAITNTTWYTLSSEYELQTDETAFVIDRKFVYSVCVIGLPSPQPNTYFIVNEDVAREFPKRHDLLIPLSVEGNTCRKDTDRNKTIFDAFCIVGG